MNRDRYDSVYDAGTVVDILKKAGYQRSPITGSDIENYLGERYFGSAPININNFILDLYEDKVLYVGDELLLIRALMGEGKLETYIGSIWYRDIIIFETIGRRVEMR